MTGVFESALAGSALGLFCGDVLGAPEPPS